MRPPETFEAANAVPRESSGDSEGSRRPSARVVESRLMTNPYNFVDSFLKGAGLDPELAELADEITERLQRGEQVDLETYAARHPEWAVTIRSLMPVLREMAELSRSVTADLNGTNGQAGPAGALVAQRVLGDYRILREVGRGGMGIVYEAEQLSLARRVALKVLPLAAAMDPRALQRFQLEAQAAALLQHPRIVPVYAIGSLGELPYYTMQFIEGASLAELINELRRLEGLSPAAPPTSSRSGGVSALARGLLAGRLMPPVTEAEAHPLSGGPPFVTPPYELAEPQCAEPDQARAVSGAIVRGRDYARAVAHLGVQAAEALDYAHGQAIVHRDIKPANLMLDRRGVLWITDFGLARIPGDSGLTLTGDMLGTLRYMSPEQALSRRSLIDRRTDIYSLGATLYELLTLTPAVTGSDREELLRKMMEDDPVPIRRINPAIPVDLATVITKALSRDPSSRYETAQHFANDLRRFLEGRSIAARRVGILAKWWRWCRRKPLPASLALGLALAILGGFSAVIWSWRNAVHQRDLMARAQFAAESALARESRAYEALVQANKRERASRELAQRRFGLATEAVEQYYTGASEDVLLKQPQMDALRKQLLGTALTFYKRLQETIEGAPEDLHAQAELAMVYRRVGQIAVEVGSRQQGLDAFEHASMILDKLIQARPSDSTPRRDQASCLALIGKLQVYTAGREDEGVRSLERSLELFEALSNEHPNDAELLLAVADVAGDLGYERARMGQIDDGLRALRRKRDILDWLAAQHPYQGSYRSRLGLTLGELGKIQATVGHLTEALSSHHQAAALFERLSTEEPTTFVHLRRLGQVGTDIGRLLADSGRPLEAIPILQRSRETLERAAAILPAVDSYQRAVAEAHDVFGATLCRLRRHDEAIRALTRARGILQSLAATRPNFVAYQADLAENYLWLGITYQDLGRDTEARLELREARELLVKMSPTTDHLYDLTRTEARLIPLTAPDNQTTQARRAMNALRLTIAKGFHSLETLRNDPCLQPLRSNRDFELLLLDLEFPAHPFFP